MPWFTLHRTFSMATTAGHVVDFKKGEKTWVPPACVPNAIALGAQPVEVTVASVEIDQVPKEPTPPVAMTPAERKKKVFAAFEVLLLRNNRGDFTASGHPHVKRLSDILQFDLPPEERDKLWMEFNEAKTDA